jgi:hypothetical protein
VIDEYAPFGSGSLGDRLYSPFKDALLHLEEAVKGLNARQSVWAQLFLAMTYHRLGEAEKGRGSLEKAVQAQRGTPPGPAPWESVVAEQATHQRGGATMRAYSNHLRDRIVAAVEATNGEEIAQKGGRDRWKIMRGSTVRRTAA